MRLPPDEATLPAAHLWRLLIVTPRPWVAIDLSEYGSKVPLRVVAPLPSDELAAFNHHDPEAVDEYLARRVVLSLYIEGGRRVFSYSQLTSLDSRACDGVVATVTEALSTIAPLRAGVDLLAWGATLKRGAETGFNSFQLARVDPCVERRKSGWATRPDVFFGLPMCQITDGQLMAFDAARKARGFTD